MKVVFLYFNFIWKKVLIFIFLLSIATACSSSPRKIDTTLTLEQLGAKSYDQGEYESALAYYKQSIQNEPSLEAYIGMAETLEKLEDWSGAAEIWMGITNIAGLSDLETDSFKVKAAKNHLRLGQSLTAKSLLDSLNDDLFMDREALSLKGLAAVLEGEENEAINNFREILKTTPDDQATLNNLALTYIVFDKPSIALPILKRVTDTNSARLNEAIALAMSGAKEAALQKAQEVQSLQEAEQTYEFALNLKQHPPQKRARILFGLE